MKLGIGLKTSLSQTLTPQQIQYLKLLQLPTVQLEQQVRQEIEMNPMIEEFSDEDDFDSEDIDFSPKDEYSSLEVKEYNEDSYDENYNDNYAVEANLADTNDYRSQELYIDDRLEPFEFQKMIMDTTDDSEYNKAAANAHSDDDFEPYQIKDNSSLIDDLTSQITLLPLTDEEKILGIQILGNIDSDGYLRRDLQEIVDETNDLIIEKNLLNINNGKPFNQNSNSRQNNSNGYFGNGHIYGHYTNGSTFSSGPNNNYLLNKGNTSINNGTHLNAKGIANGLTNPTNNGIQSKGIYPNGSGYNSMNGNSSNLPYKMPNQVSADLDEDKTVYSHRNDDSKDNEEAPINPAKFYKLSAESKNVLQTVFNENPELMESVDSDVLTKIQENQSEIVNKRQLKTITMQDAENVLNYIKHLDPPGIGSRSVQECLLSQLEVLPRQNASQKLAYEVLSKCYEAFAKKHYPVITKQLDVTDEYLRQALEVIRSLNPRPGGGDFVAENNTVIPDFMVDIEDDTDELLISVNDTRMPILKLSKAYDNMKKEAQYKAFNKETREWIRTKREDAKFLIQALKQRKSTMLKVMTAIAQLQKDFFFDGPSALKPLIYKDIAEETGMDISTVCRIVNGKFVQTRFGTFELKFFFSESLPSDEGEEVSTRVIKQILKEVIDEENKDKPHSDDKLSKMLKTRGYNVARRTVAKYREQLNIPVARLRKEL